MASTRFFGLLALRLLQGAAAVLVAWAFTVLRVTGALGTSTITGYWLPGFLDWFALGMAAAVIQVRLGMGGAPAWMGAVRQVAQAQRLRTFRALVASSEANRALVLMGAYRVGADPLIDRGIALQPRISAFLAQGLGETVSFDQSMDDLEALVGDIE